MKKSLKKNAVLNSLRMILRLIFPIIEIPYISRVLGVENLGKYNFAYSIVNYFILIAGLGISTFAVREGAQYRDNKERFNKFASEVFTINMFSTILSYILLLICLLFIPNLANYKILIIILSLEIILTTIGCEWVYTIYEDYGYITIRTIIFQIISLILLLIFVRNSNDLIIYTIIMVISATGCNILNLKYLKKYCKLKFVVDKNTKKYIVPILILFANSVTTTIYCNSDITILGILANDYYVGVYSISAKIYNVIKQIISSIIIVSIPRLSYLLGNNKKEEFKNTASKILQTLIVVLFPVMFGIISIAYQTIYIIAGIKYIEGVRSLQILAIALMFCIFGWFYTSCILIPAKKEKFVLKYTIVAALANIILNILFIPKFKQDVAAFTTALAEAISFIMCYIKSKEVVKIDVPIKTILKTLIGSFGILVFCLIINKFTNLNIMVNTIVSILGSIAIYVGLEFLLRNDIFIDLFNSVIKKFIKKLNKAEE